MRDMQQAYEEYFHTVYGFLLSLTGGNQDLSEELAQETFYRAVKNVSGFKGECKMSTWLCQIAKYTFYQHLKKVRRRGEVPMDELKELETGMQLEKEFINTEAKLKIYKEIQKLGSPMKDVLLFRLTGELSFREIGHILGKTENWARVTFYRAKQILGKELEKND